jgi:UDP-glucuronate 4-epimerase
MVSYWRDRLAFDRWQETKLLMKILVTGSAGFIGSALALRLLERGDTVIGIDNHNDYYDPTLKEARVRRFNCHSAYSHHRIDLCDGKAIANCFSEYKPQRVVNLAAQAGVRYSIENPLAYINSNIIGFTHILEGCRHNNVEHLVYASTSSIYGANMTMPFSIHESANHPLSFYAATKKANELMAHTYSYLHAVPTTGLRFFTVYGPWGRPDMALFKFTKSILSGQPIQVFNYGKHRRDFTYIDDIIEGIIRILDCPASVNSNWNGLQPDPATSNAPWRVYNIGNNKPVDLMDYISTLEQVLGKPARIELLPLQAGDVSETYADVKDLIDEFGYQPSTSIREGITNFVSWYRDYFEI